jgi:hypothetical protein
MNQHRKAKQELTRQAEANGSTIQAANQSDEWRYLETMVHNGEFERIENDGIYITYHLVKRDAEATKED